MLEPIISSRAADAALAVNYFALHGFWMCIYATNQEKNLARRRAPYTERVKRREHLAQRAGDLKKLLIECELAAAVIPRGAG